MKKTLFILLSIISLTSFANIRCQSSTEELVLTEQKDTPSAYELRLEMNNGASITIPDFQYTGGRHTYSFKSESGTVVIKENFQTAKAEGVLITEDGNQLDGFSCCSAGSLFFYPRCK